jgi:hypothetical protein
MRLRGSENGIHVRRPDRGTHVGRLSLLLRAEDPGLLRGELLFSEEALVLELGQLLQLFDGVRRGRRWSGAGCEAYCSCGS